MERAGLTDAPDSVAEPKWMATSVNGIASGARPAARLVDTRITRMKPAVSTISRISAPMSVTSPPGPDRADDLGEDVTDGVGRVGPLVEDRRDRDRRVEVAAADMAHREDRREQTQSERERDDEQTRDAARTRRRDRRVSDRQEQERADQFGQVLAGVHGPSWVGSPARTAPGQGGLDATRSVQPRMALARTIRWCPNPRPSDATTTSA